MITLYRSRVDASAANREIPFTSVDEADGKTRITGALTSFTVRHRKPGMSAGTDVAGAGSTLEVSASNQPGVRVYTATAGELDTLGTGGVFVFLATGMEPREVPYTLIDDKPAIVGSHTRDDLERLAMAVLAGPVQNHQTGSLEYRCPVTNTVRLTVSAPPNGVGRLSTTLGDLT
jgi:hypothetical protein